MDEIGISANVHGDINAALGQIEDSLDDVGDAGAKMGAKVRAGGEEAARGIDKATRSTHRARDANGRFIPLGQETSRTLTEQERSAIRASRGLDQYAKKANKASRSAGGLAGVLMILKWSTIITGGFAAVGMLAALGAAAVIAVGGLAPMVGIFAAIGPLMFAGAAAMLAWKLGGDAAKATLKPLTEDFKALSYEINAVMLPGMRSMVRVMRDQLVPVLGGGLINVGDIIGYIAEEFGVWATSEHSLNRIGLILQSMSPIMRPIATGLMSILSVILDITAGALPMVTRMAAGFAHMTRKSAAWTKQMYENGRMAAWLNKAWLITTGVVEVLADLVIGLYNIFRIAGGFAGDMGRSVADLTAKFRTWTVSAEGQQRITQYFQDTLPAIRETALILGMIARGIAGLAANQDVAPLLQQIRTEFLPALGELVARLTGEGGLSSALVDAATSTALLFANLDFSGLTAFVQAIAAFANAILWISQNVPGANMVISALLFSMLGFKLLGPVFSMVAGGFAAFVWMYKAKKGVGELSLAQKVFATTTKAMGTAIGFVGRAFGTMAMAGVRALITLSVALVTTPIGWLILAIMAIVGAIILLWNNCEWFRDAVTAVWEWIKNAAVVAWDWIVDAVGGAISWIAEKATWMWENVIKPIWEFISTVAVMYWNAWVAVVKTAIDIIAGIVTWLWENVIRPIWNVIATSAEIFWNVVVFIVRVVIYIIAGIIWVLAKIAEKVWESISTSFMVVWDAIVVAVKWFGDLWATVTGWIGQKWGEAVALVTAVWNALWATYVQPKIDWFVALWTTVTGWIGQKWDQVVGLITTAWNALWEVYIQPKIDWISEKWTWLTDMMGAMWTIATTILAEKWNGFKDMVGGVIDWIVGVWRGFANTMLDFFRPVGDGFALVFDGIGKTAEKVASIVAGAWNGLKDTIKGFWNSLADKWNNFPSITIPDWLPGGGGTFSLPKVQKLWHGGEMAPGEMALTGERGPEPVVADGRFMGMVGMDGPELATLPKGGYVVPNLDTLTRLPGLTKTLPRSVADAVAGAVPGYADVLGRRSGLDTVEPPAITVRTGADNGTATAIRELAHAVAAQRPPLAVGSNATKSDVLAALRQHDRERELKNRYRYGDD